MTINPIISAYGAESLRSIQRTQSRKSADAGSNHVSPKNEHVEISAASQQMKKVREALDKSPEIRLQLVEELRFKIANNDYPIDNKLDKIVEQLVSEQPFD